MSASAAPSVEFPTTVAAGAARFVREVVDVTIQINWGDATGSVMPQASCDGVSFCDLLASPVTHATAVQAFSAGPGVTVVAVRLDRRVVTVAGTTQSACVIGRTP